MPQSGALILELVEGLFTWGDHFRRTVAYPIPFRAVTMIGTHKGGQFIGLFAAGY